MGIVAVRRHFGWLLGEKARWGRKVSWEKLYAAVSEVPSQGGGALCSELNWDGLIGSKSGTQSREIWAFLWMIRRIINTSDD